MSERGSKRGGPAEEGVLGNLPSTRPTRMGRHRDGGPEQAPQAGAEVKPKKAAAKSKATAKPKATTKPKAPAAKPKAPAPKAEVPASKPRPVRAGSPDLKRPKKVPPAPPAPSTGPPKGTELVTTAVQAAGELAQIGVSLSGRALKRAVDRLPKP